MRKVLSIFSISAFPFQLTSDVYQEYFKRVYVMSASKFHLLRARDVFLLILTSLYIFSCPGFFLMYFKNNVYKVKPEVSMSFTIF